MKNINPGMQECKWQLLLLLSLLIYTEQAYVSHLLHMHLWKSPAKVFGRCRC